MKPVKDLLNSIEIKNIVGTSQQSVNSIHFDSRAIEENDLFVAIKGEKSDGHNYIDKAIANGAKCIVCETEPKELSEDVTYINVDNSNNALGNIANHFYNEPSEKLKLVGVTGTNGKTTVATLLYTLFRKLGFKVGLLSTIANYVDDKKIATKLTTPDPIQINKLLDEMVQIGCEYCFMEVSSHSVVQQRIEGLTFVGGIYTNLTHEHLDYHKTFDEYIKVKKMFFDILPKDAFALVNVDDRNGNVMLQNTKARKKTYAIKSMADFKCRIYENSFDGMKLEFDNIETWTGFTGEFNAYNLLAVYSCALLLENIEKDQILMVLSALTPVVGRFQTIRSSRGINAIVDYAHTPDALENVLKTIYQIRKGDEQILTVVGTGGDRDKTKRPIMAAIAAKYSDKVILTSDNPRTEDPEAILADMQKGLVNDSKTKAVTITNRLEAIKTVCFMANKDDIILVAGKGHEDYQEINGVRHHFDDTEILQEYL